LARHARSNGSKAQGPKGLPPVRPYFGPLAIGRGSLRTRVRCFRLPRSARPAEATQRRAATAAFLPALNIRRETRRCVWNAAFRRRLLSCDEPIPGHGLAPGPLAWCHLLCRRMVCWSVGGAPGADEAELVSMPRYFLPRRKWTGPPGRHLWHRSSRGPGRFRSRGRYSSGALAEPIWETRPEPFDRGQGKSGPFPVCNPSRSPDHSPGHLKRVCFDEP
jgi:hypothetical protein